MISEAEGNDVSQFNQLISPSYLRTQSRQGRQSNEPSYNQHLLVPQNSSQLDTSKQVPGQFAAYQQSQASPMHQKQPLLPANVNLGNKAY